MEGGRKEGMQCVEMIKEGGKTDGMWKRRDRMERREMEGGR